MRASAVVCARARGPRSVHPKPARPRIGPAPPFGKDEIRRGFSASAFKAAEGGRLDVDWDERLANSIRAINSPYET